MLLISSHDKNRNFQIIRSSRIYRTCSQREKAIGVFGGSFYHLERACRFLEHYVSSSVSLT